MAKKIEVETTQNDEVPFPRVSEALLASATKLGANFSKAAASVEEAQREFENKQNKAWGGLLSEIVAFGEKLKPVLNGKLDGMDREAIREAIMKGRLVDLQAKNPDKDIAALKKTATPNVTNIMQVLVGVVEGRELPEGVNNLQRVAFVWREADKTAALEAALAEVDPKDTEKAAEVKAAFEEAEKAKGGRPVGTTKTPEGSIQMLTPSNFKGPGVSEADANDVFAMLEQLQDLGKKDFANAIATLKGVLMGLTAKLAANESEAA